MEFDLYARGVPLIFSGSFRRQLAVSLGEQTARDVMRKGRSLYGDIVVRSPSIGGRKNPNTMNVLVAAFVAAIYKAADGKLSPEGMGEVFSNAVEHTTAFKLFAKLTGKRNFTRQWQDKRHQWAVASQGKAYPADFVSTFVYGKTINEYGVTYSECGICKLLQREGCAELAPELCKFDYVTAKYMGCTLTRTKTIANGDEMCDFWFSKNV
ncbi:MAG: L-2-amino-thiazoline-4-carboxylic acid hydrolase [Syntrophorhabdales bacterium]|jgi:hypothetical protein